MSLVSGFPGFPVRSDVPRIPRKPDGTNRSVRNAPNSPDARPDELCATRTVSGESEIMSSGQSQVRWTTPLEPGDKFRTCPERDRIPFF